MRNPTVSVILCSFNRSTQVTQAIRSVLAQSFTDFELIVVDDGSTDQTSDVVLPLARRDARMIYIRQANSGLAAARNAGIRMARGTWACIPVPDPEHVGPKSNAHAHDSSDRCIHARRVTTTRQYRQPSSGSHR